MYSNTYQLPQSDGINTYGQRADQVVDSYRKLALWGVFLFHLVVLVTCIMSPALSPNSTPALLGGLAMAFAACWMAFAWSNSRILHMLVAWHSISFTAKLPLCLYFKDETYLYILGLAAKQTGAIVTENYTYFAAGMLVMVLTTLIVPRIFPWQEKLGHQNVIPAPGGIFFLVAIISCIAICFHFIVLFVLGIGRPGMIPRFIFIPGLTGFVALLSRTGVVVAVASLLALAMSRRKFSSFFIAILFVLAYMAVDLASGWRRSLFVVVFCLFWFFLFIADTRLKNRLTPALTAFGILCLLLFGPVMTLRHAMLHKGLQPMDAFRQMVSQEFVMSQDFHQSMHSVIRRFNGLDLFVVCAETFERQPLGAGYLVSGRFSATFTHEVVGVPDDVVAAFGSTLWGVYAGALGKSGIWLCGVFVAMVLIIGEKLCSLAKLHPAALAVCEVSFCMWLFRLTMGSGVLLLAVKDALILFIVLVVFHKLTWGSPAMRAHANRWANQLSYRLGLPRRA